MPEEQIFKSKCTNESCEAYNIIIESGLRLVSTCGDCGESMTEVEE